MSQWKPIATAPMDASRFLTYQPEEKEGRRIQVSWQNQNGVMVVGTMFSFDTKPVTHWMPLPEEPNGEVV